MKISSLFLASVLAFALPVAAQGLSDETIDAERARIGAQRSAAEARHAQERVGCYQRFAVEDCLRESRARLRAESDDLRRQENMLNDIQRKRRGAEQLRRLDERQAAPQGPSTQERAELLEAQRAREARAAEAASKRASMAAEAEQNRLNHEARQRTHAEDAADAARRRAQEPAARERFENKQREALRRREARNKANADPDRVRAAPLPVPSR